MTRIIGRAGLAGFTGIILTLSASVEPATAVSYYFPDQKDDYTATQRVLNRSAVRIFRSEKESHDGSGVVIDSEAGLIITAAHVVRGINGPVWVAFPNSPNHHKAYVQKPDSMPPDFAVLKLDKRKVDAGALEIQLESIDEDRWHLVTGFGRANVAPVLSGWLKPSKQQEDCSYGIRVPTMSGDSGSVVVTSEGLIDGIAVEGAESGGSPSMAETLVLPLACVLDRILTFVPDSDSAAILKIFRSGDEQELRAAFQPSPIARGWFSNLRLAKALSGWIAEHDKNRKLPPLVDSKRMPQVMPIIVERRLGYDLLNKFTLAVSSSMFNAGDHNQNLGDSLREQGFIPDAARAYAQAQEFYFAYAVSLLPDSWSAAAGATANGLEIAKAYKAAADSTTKLAEITRNETEFKLAASLAHGSELRLTRILH